MNTKKTLTVITLVMLMLAVNACGPASTPTSAPIIIPTQDTTSIVETSQALVFGTMTQMALSSPSSTLTPMASNTSLGSPSPFATATIYYPPVIVYNTVIPTSSTPSKSPTPTITQTPVVDFTISNTLIRTCSGEKFMDVTVTNTGTSVFKSGSVSITDKTVANTVPELFSTEFVYKVNCDVHFSQGDLAPKEFGNLSSAAIPFPFSGHNFGVTVKLCAADDGSNCIVKAFSFDN
jgi:hypothetical protein